MFCVFYDNGYFDGNEILYEYIYKGIFYRIGSFFLYSSECCLYLYVGIRGWNLNLLEYILLFKSSFEKLCIIMYFILIKW